MSHIFFIDNLKKLVIRKDTSLFMALTFLERGESVYFVFEEDLYFLNKEKKIPLKVYPFEGQFQSKSFYLKEIKLKRPINLKIKRGDTIHMRIDPPFDSRYLRFLWILNEFKERGVSVVNDPAGILLMNEKLLAYRDENSLPSYVGMNFQNLIEFVKRHEIEQLILKPLDLFQGIGVKKLKATPQNLHREFKKIKGAMIAQPFYEEIMKGETRAIYYNGKELGSILKIPKRGTFLANIAQGATFKKTELTKKQRAICNRVAKKLLKVGVTFIAFDLFGEHLSEVNITCPGLLVEVSEACGKNLAIDIF